MGRIAVGAHGYSDRMGIFGKACRTVLKSFIGGQEFRCQLDRHGASVPHEHHSAAADVVWFSGASGNRVVTMDAR